MTKLNEDSKPEFIGQIVDVFEDWLAEKEIILKNPERENAIEDEEIEPEEAAIIYGDHYDMIGDTISQIIEEHSLMEKPFEDMEIQRRQIETIMDAFYEMLKDGGQKRSLIEAKDSVKLKDKIGNIFRKWGLLFWASAD